MNGIFTTLLYEMEKHHDTVLCTIIADSGSTPRGKGAQMLVGETGLLSGTIGGGAVEGGALALGQTLLRERRSAVHEYKLRHNDGEDIGMVCGGDVTVHLQFIAAGDPVWKELAGSVLHRIALRQPGALVLALDGGAPALRDVPETDSAHIALPLPIGERLLVGPQWLSPENPEHRIPVLLDPGMIFGTGAHASTQMCMRELERTIRGGERVLDLGSGSGILSITALLLGAKTAVGVDIDPKAESIARENAAYNGFAVPAFTACTGDVTKDAALMDALSQKEYDLVLVNIVADVIIGLAPVLPRFLTMDSTLICSGILDTRLDDVTAALERAGLTVDARYAREDWRCVTAKRSIS